VSEHVPGRVAPTRVLLVACFGAFLAFLDATIVNVAFPSIRESFPEASISALSWVLNAYNIVFAAFLVVCGRLTDLIGRRRAYVGGIALFTWRRCGVRRLPPWSSSWPAACSRHWERRCSCRPRWPS
jgi:MFS family permease